MNSLPRKSQFNALSPGLYQSAPTTLQSPLFLTISLHPTENGTACFYFRICQVTAGASPGSQWCSYYGGHRSWTSRVKPAGRHCFHLRGFHTKLNLSDLPASWPFPPFICPPRARTLAARSPHAPTARPWLIHWGIFRDGFTRYCSQAVCLHRFQQI